jgi:hypothetical protein
MPPALRSLCVFAGSPRTAEEVFAVKILAPALCAAALLLGASGGNVGARPGTHEKCKPSSLGSAVPGYRPGSPVRSRSGRGHVLVGVVRSSRTCGPIGQARLEFFQAIPGVGYSAAPSWAGRATVFSRLDGSYRYESDKPASYRGNRPHIHVRVSAPGFRAVFGVHDLRPGEKRARVDYRTQARVSEG